MTLDRNAALAEPSRRALLLALRDADGPLDVRTLAGLVGLHPNSAREQLRRLTDAGLVRVTIAAPSGRGRPGLRYGATPDALADPYRMLAGILADELAHQPDASAKTAAAGERWGRQAATRMADAGPGRDAIDPAAGLLALLAEAGFAPETPSTGDAELRLHACPFLPIDSRHLHVVCGVHLGFIRGALRELGSTRDAVAIEPFVRPDLCVARLEEMPSA